MSVDEYITELDSPLREIAQKLRTVILDSDKAIVEEIKWNVPVYSLNKNICSIVAHKKHVNFQFFHGGHIPDAAQLQGTGKDMRHLKYTSASEVNKNDVQRYLKQALELDRSAV